MEKSRSMQCQVFVDPLYGSERFLNFDPAWVVEARNASKWLLFRRAVPVTHITFSNGESHVVHGHWAEQIEAEQKSQQAQTQAETKSETKGEAG